MARKKKIKEATETTIAEEPVKEETVNVVEEVNEQVKSASSLIDSIITKSNAVPIDTERRKKEIIIQPKAIFKPVVNAPKLQRPIKPSVAPKEVRKGTFCFRTKGHPFVCGIM